MPRILVTNHTRGSEAGVYLLETETGGLRRLYDRRVNGITRGRDGIYFIEPDGIICHLDPATWKVTQRCATPYQACHDLRAVGDEFYLVASTGNRVVRLDSSLNVLDELRVVQSDDDICHANCIEAANGHLLLSIFTLSPGRRQEKNTTPVWFREGKVLRLDWETKSFEIVYEPLCQPHSLVWHGEQLYCCESLTSEVSILDLKSKTKKLLRRMHGFARGIAFHGDSVFIGISQRKNNEGPLLDRLLARFRIPCGVVELDARTWKPRRDFRIPGRQVYELLIVDEA
ncbi:MAG: DUF4915 domain-containing protein [Armatimonadota bacterium]